MCYNDEFKGGCVKRGKYFIIVPSFLILEIRFQNVFLRLQLDVYQVFFHTGCESYNGRKS